MIYFKKEKDGSISKWDVTYDEEKLKLIREEVIDKFSDVFYHEHYLTKEELEIIESNDIYKNIEKKQSSDNKFFVTYEKYMYPRLVELIDSLLENDFSVLNEIETPIETKQNYYKDMIESLNEEIDTIDNYDVNRKIKKLEELREMIYESKKNKEKKDISKYYDMVNDTINIQLLRNLNVNDVVKFEEFFDINTEEVIKTKKK